MTAHIRAWRGWRNLLDRAALRVLTDGYGAHAPTLVMQPPPLPNCRSCIDREDIIDLDAEALRAPTVWMNSTSHQSDSVDARFAAFMAGDRNGSAEQEWLLGH